MRSRVKTGRLVLDEAAIESLNRILEALIKESAHLKVSPSKIVSLILSDYEEKFFIKEKKGLVSRLFDKRSYLRHALETAKSEDELEAMIRFSMLAGCKKKKKRPSGATSCALNDLKKEVGI